METGRRKIKDGKDYNDLFPTPTTKDTTVKKSADVEDTVSLIRRTVPKTLWHTRKIAERLRGKDLEETCSNIWHFVYDHIQYKRDKDGVEQVRSPRRTWWERESGVDCDCYTEFISSILLNLNIPHKARIAKYPKLPPEEPRWQHIYPIVPKDGKLNREFTSRDDYIAIDCVKDNYDDEQPFLECKDYDMRLDYLDGIDEEDSFADYDSADANDIASVYDDTEEMGKIGFFKKLGTAVKKGVRILNRYTNPGTILLRNGLLLAMKVNLFNVAGRLRFGYLTDAQATAMGMNLEALNKLRHVKERAESIYYQAGGKKENFKKAILKGKGNKNKKVPMNGLDGLEEVYADYDEYRILNSDDNELAGLGIVGATSIAAATSALVALGTALKSIKGLFNKGGNEEQAFQSDTDNAGDASAVTSSSDNNSEEDLIDEPEYQMPSNARQISLPPGYSPSPVQSVLPASASYSPSNNSLVAQEAKSSEIQVSPDLQQGVTQKATSWVKENPGKSLLIAGAAIGGGFLIYRAMSAKHKSSVGELNGPPRKRKPKPKPRAKSGKKQTKIRTIKL